MAALSKQENLAVNTNKSQVYWEDSESPLCYNYKTDQWSRLPAYVGIGMYSVLSGVNIGLARVSGTAVDLQQPTTLDPASTAVITTGESTFNDGFRRMITGVRPLLTGADANVSIKYRDEFNPDTEKNYFLWSEDLSNAAWTKTNATITTNQAQAPDGETTADDFSGDGGGSVEIKQTMQNLGSTGDDYVVSFYAKYLDHRYIKVINENVGFVAEVWFDIVSGLVFGSLATTGKVVGSGVEDITNGWFRCYVVFSNDDTATPEIGFNLIQDDAAAYTGTNGMYLWGIQAIPASALGSYVKSTSAIGTEPLSTSEERVINSRSGIAPFRIDSRYHRISVRVEGGFTTILGADVEYEPTGEI